MVHFKVGQRVRIVEAPPASWLGEWFMTQVLRLPNAPESIGREGVIVARYTGLASLWLHWEVSAGGAGYFCSHAGLVPLSGPNAWAVEKVRALSQPRPELLATP